MPAVKHHQRPVGARPSTVAHVPAVTDEGEDRRALTRHHPGCSIDCACHGRTRFPVVLTIRYAGVVALAERFSTGGEAWEYAHRWARHTTRQNREDPRMIDALRRRSEHPGIGGFRSPRGFTYTVHVDL